jgi:hypothetical protein
MKKMNKEKMVINDSMFKLFTTNKKNTLVVECISYGNHINSLFNDLKTQYDVYGADGNYMNLDGIKFIYVTTYSDLINGHLCGQENEYRISRTSIVKL